MGLVLHKSPAHVGLSCVTFLDHSYSHHPKGSVIGSGQALEALHSQLYSSCCQRSLPSPTYARHHVTRSCRAHALLFSSEQPLPLILLSVFTQGWPKQPPFLSHGLPSLTHTSNTAKLEGEATALWGSLEAASE